MKKNVAVIFGSRSAEHDVSIITAHVPIMNTLKTMSDYRAVPIYITKDGSWYSFKELSDIKTFTAGKLDVKLKQEKKARLVFDDGLEIVVPGFRGTRVKIDVAFPATHGTYGEDGSLMGLLRMANVPFVGCDIFASTIAMDKILTKQVTMSAGLPSVKFVWFTAREWDTNQAEVKKRIKTLKFPVFVKPAHLGSSIAITKVKKQSELENALEVALHYDDKVLVEESVEDLIEVTVPIMGNDEYKLALVEQPNAEFFDFDTKYMRGGKKGGGKQGGGKGGVNANYSKLPADLPPKTMKEIQDLTKRTFAAIGGSGIARVDFLISKKGYKAYVNEVNTLPGSLYEHNWRAAGVSNIDLIGRLIALAEQRHAQQQKLATTFNSSFLQQF